MGYNTEFDGEFPVKSFDRNDDFIKSRIFSVRGVQVMLSVDLAPLYGVEVKYLHRQVRRNENRFPFDFEVIHKLRIAERGRIADALPKLKKRLFGAA